MSSRSTSTSSRWDVESLGEVCRKGGGSIQTGPFGSQLHAEDYKDDGMPIITVEHLCEGKIAHENLPLVGEWDVQRLSRYVLREGDLVFSRVGAIDRCAYVTRHEDGWLFSGRCLRVRPGRGKANARFLSYLLNSSPQRQWILNHSVGSTMACLNTKILSGVPIELPADSEQRRIAEILGTVDEAIEQTEALVQKWQQMKAGLMHDLFTRGVTPDGQLRPTRQTAPHLYHQSPLGWIPNEWEVATVGSCLLGIDAGKSPDCPDTPASGEQWGVLKVGAVNSDGFREAENKVVLDDKLKNPAFLVRDGDILLSRANTFQLVGMVCQVTGAPQNLMLSDKTLRLQPDLSRITRRFLALSLQGASARGQIETVATGTSGSMKNIGQSSVKAIRIVRPKNEEQTQITERIDALSDVVSTLSKSLTKLRAQKQGLMQDLLTGRVRVERKE